MKTGGAIAVSVVWITGLAAQDSTVPLSVPAGTPLRLYLTKRVSKTPGAIVEGRLLVPVFAFDHEVIPSGSGITGRVTRVIPVSRWQRTRAIMGGDFTPLRVAQIEFTSLTPAGGAPLELRTTESGGLTTLYPLVPVKKRASTGSGVKAQARDAVNAQVDKIRSIPDVVRSPGKAEWFYDYAMSRLPYHPQYIRNRTRFDAELTAPLSFGSETLSAQSLTLLGTQPDAGSVVHARLTAPLDSLTSKKGDRVEAVLEEPVFSADHRLVMPEGTSVTGTVSMAKKAGWFHRGGRLRFAFENLNLSEETLALMNQPRQSTPLPTLATLADAESGAAPLKVDKEGGVEAKESNTRFLGTALALLVAGRAADNDPKRDSNHVIIGQRANIGGRTLGGGMGFGLLGSIAAQSSRNVGTALGYYGLAWSIYSTVIARGAEVHFDKDAVIDVGFNRRAVAAATQK